MTGYYGGKSASGRGTGAWIRSLLPEDRDATYVETHGGMLGVMLARPKVKNEIANDLNGRVVNWWKVVRDKPDEFTYKLAHTPRSERLFEESKATMDEGEDVDRAIKLHVVMSCSIMHGDGEAAHFGIRYSGRVDVPNQEAKSIAVIAARLSHVQLLDRPAVKLLERLADLKHAVVYVDPPYRTAHTATYSVNEQDYDETVRLLKAQKGRVAVSGYGHEWDDLGWQRHEFATVNSVLAGGQQDVSARTEVLWTNYRVKQERLV